MGRKKNKNITPLTEAHLRNEINYKNFPYKEYFKHLCILIPNQEKERITIETTDQDKIKEKGLVYVFVIEDKIFKIGPTVTSIKERVNSYNCGKTEYRISGTNSTTNYFILQSILKINKKVKVYAFFPEKPRFNLFGIEYIESYPPAKVAENKILTDFISKFNRKPIACTQT